MIIWNQGKYFVNNKLKKYFYSYRNKNTLILQEIMKMIKHQKAQFAVLLYHIYYGGALVEVIIAPKTS